MLDQRGRDIDVRTHSFKEWLSAPLGRTSHDSRFEVRRASPEDFERIFDLVDTVFETRRARAAYEWLYRANPNGTARCWLVIERDSGNLVASESRFPWPTARGSEGIEGVLCGDFATLPRVQRQGLFHLRSEIRDSHPWRHRTIALSVPNPKSRGAVAKHGHKHSVIGPLPRRALLLNCVDYLRSRAWPDGATRTMGGAADTALGLWHRVTLTSPSNIRIEELKHFDSGIDALTYSCMSTPAYWCPHESDFLNWRYFGNPVTSYLAHVALVDDQVKGYSVVRVENRSATLMEFAAVPAPEPVASALLCATIGATREAGCYKIDFYATSSWRFWALFRRAGFIKRNSEIYLTARCPDRADVSQEANWQILPGDSDVL